jgi:hypothetical protein
VTTDACVEERKQELDARHELHQAQAELNQFVKADPFGTSEDRPGFKLEDWKRASDRLENAKAVLKDRECALSACELRHRRA